ncbi:hypothetical protein FKR81_26715 [Lentzea tibetensis]|uniref:Uncharacterized protein n=1 Tax=Lentzea tibetensis TaxID=2591470 RepID=A0A563EP63_9PSEU|nr:hypothetical protein [Lentzea tibetensis]TWP48888.1 hypothetical protein FKR81_26715 [Lentzea tibetensis]
MTEVETQSTPGWRLAVEAALLTVGIGTIMMIGWADDALGVAGLVTFVYAVWWLGKRKTPVSIGSLGWLVAWDLLAVFILLVT